MVAEEWYAICMVEWAPPEGVRNVSKGDRRGASLGNWEVSDGPNFTLNGNPSLLAVRYCGLAISAHSTSPPSQAIYINISTLSEPSFSEHSPTLFLVSRT